jgi:hypothetical protein
MEGSPNGTDRTEVGGIAEYLFTIIRVILSAAAIGLLVLAPVAAAEKPVAAKKKTKFDKDGVHHVSVSSHLYAFRIDRKPRPALVTLTVEGADALTEFCNSRPVVNAAVLEVLSDEYVVSGDDQSVLAVIKPLLQEALKSIFPEGLIKKINVQLASSMTTFGPEILKTRMTCRAAKV